VVAGGLQGCLRVGVAASRSVGGAVQRNRARRLLREAMRPLLGQVASGQDILLVARAHIREASSSEVSAAVQALLQKAKLVLGDNG
jgi:ribonuclease P protein component